MQIETTEEIKNIILTELPELVKREPDIRNFILDVTHDIYADKRETENRIDRILDELKRDRETREKRWEEESKAQAKKWEAQEKRWQENQRVINEMLASIKELDCRIACTIGVLGARWGLQAEGAFRRGLRSILEKSFDIKVERYKDFDYDGTVFGRPDQVELDVIIHNGILILCEIKSSISKPDIYTFWRKKKFYENKHKVRVNRIIVISPMIENRARIVTGELNIEVYGYPEEVIL